MIRATPEFRRIDALPRRPPPDPRDPTLHQLADEFTALFKTPNGQQRIRHVQALALHDLGTMHGLFAPIGTGDGKTLISLLAAELVDSVRPALLLPAGLAKKTHGELKDYARHWRVPTHVRIFSYDMLGRQGGARDLEVYKPDLIIADEVHRLKNRNAAVTRRVERYMTAHPTTMFVALTGTMMRKSLHEFAHILRWCLKGRAPVPESEAELAEWAQALDDTFDVFDLRQLRPGVLLSWATPEDARDTTDENVIARRGFRRRLEETPGIVASLGTGEAVDATITIRAIEYPVSATTTRHFTKLREEQLTPDDWGPLEPVDVWRHARELALGFHYVWDPRPPEEWRQARRAWHAFVRAVLQQSKVLDSESQVAAACEAGHLPDAALRRWRAIEPAFVVNQKAVWHDTSALDTCVAWLDGGPGLVWTEHTFFARRLSELTGVPYYGAKGLDPDGRSVEHATPGASAIVSIDANREGRNLQKLWHRNLITCPPDGWDAWQQTIARTHRPGQLRDEVIVDVLLGCAEHDRAVRRALEGASTIRDTVGTRSKLLEAQLDWPSEDEVASWRGARWR